MENAATEVQADTTEQTIEIRDRWDDKLLFTHTAPANNIAVTLRAAVADGANLTRANLYGANLTRANLDGANLYGANLDGANLTRANLYGANLTRANLYGANLDGANLTRANLYGANLTRANLYGANLDGANLYGANLDGANLTPVRDDVWAVLSSAPREVPALIEALKTGRVDGSSYRGECACLVGTIANAREVDYQNLGSLKANGNRAAERFFMGIKKGDTPETSQFSAIALGWAEEWLATMRAAFAPVEGEAA
jgi:hypothetical protein